MVIGGHWWSLGCHWGSLGVIVDHWWSLGGHWGVIGGHWGSLRGIVLPFFENLLELSLFIRFRKQEKHLVKITINNAKNNASVKSFSESSLSITGNEIGELFE